MFHQRYKIQSELLHRSSPKLNIFEGLWSKWDWIVRFNCLVGFKNWKYYIIHQRYKIQSELGYCTNPHQSWISLESFQANGIGLAGALPLFSRAARVRSAFCHAKFSTPAIRPSCHGKIKMANSIDIICRSIKRPLNFMLKQEGLWVHVGPE